MRKLATILFTMCILAGATYAADNSQQVPHKKTPPTKEQMEKIRKAHEEAFDQKLGLTEAQKKKAKELRQSGFEKMKPTMDKIKAKRQEAEAIKNNKTLKEADKEAKLAAIKKDIVELKKQASEIRKQNMKDFESILTKEQKEKLKQMKKEGRKNFEKKRNLPKPPCQKSQPEKK